MNDNDNDYLDALNNRQRVMLEPEELRPVFYMAHPVTENIDTGSRGPENFKTNIARAKKWLAWFMLNDRSRVYIAPWIVEVQLVDEGVLFTSYEEALRDDEEVVRRVDGLVMVGGKITEGMRREFDVACARSIEIIDISGWREPPESDTEEFDALVSFMDNNMDNNND